MISAEEFQSQLSTHKETTAFVLFSSPIVILLVLGIVSNMTGSMVAAIGSLLLIAGCYWFIASQMENRRTKLEQLLSMARVLNERI